MCLSPQWCVLCKSNGEVLDHLLLHCPFTYFVWLKVFRALQVQVVMPKSWKELSKIQWFQGGNKKRTKVLWRCIFMAASWCVWTQRNERIFENKESEKERVWDRVLYLSSQWAYPYRRIFLGWVLNI